MGAFALNGVSTQGPTEDEREWIDERRGVLLSCYSTQPILRHPEKRRQAGAGRGGGRALPPDTQFLQDPRARSLGWNLDTMVSMGNLDARSITSGEARPTYGRPRTVEVYAYETRNNAVEGGWRAPLEEWKRNLAQHVQSNATVLLSVPSTRPATGTAPRGGAGWSGVAPASRQSSRSPFTPSSRSEPRAHTSQSSRSGRSRPAGNPTGRRLASASGGRSLLPNQTDQRAECTVTLDTHRPISPNTRASLLAEPLEESDAEDGEEEEALGGAQGGRQRARKVGVRDTQRDAVQAAVDAAGCSGDDTDTELGEGTWVAGAADEKVVAVVRQVLEALYVGYGDAVDAYVGLLEPGSNTLRYIGRRDGLPADKKTLQRPQGLSWPVVDVGKTLFVKDVQKRAQVKWLGAPPTEEDDDAAGMYIAAPIHSPGVSGVLGLVAVDSYQFNKKGKEASWKLGPADVQTLTDVGEMVGEWLDAYRKAQVLRRVGVALQWGVVERRGMYTAAAHALRNVVLDGAWFVALAVPVEGHRIQESVPVAWAGREEACFQLAAAAAALPRVKRCAVQETHNGKAAVCGCVSSGRQPHTLLAMMKAKGRFRPGDLSFLQALAKALSGATGLEGSYRRAVAAELADEALQWIATRTVDVGCEASSGGAGGCFAVLQPDAHAAQYVVARDPKAAQLLGTMFALDEAAHAPRDAESGMRAALISATPKPDAPGFPPALCQPVLTKDGQVIGALKVSMEGVAPQHESFFRQQVSLAAAALAAAASANAARSAPWRLRNKELGLSGVASSERLAFNHKLLNLIRESTKTRIRTQFNTIKMMEHPAEELTRIVTAVAALNVGMDVGKSWAVYRTVLTNPLWVERALSWNPAVGSDLALARAKEALRGVSPLHLAVHGPLAAHLLLEWLQCCFAIHRLTPPSSAIRMLPVIPDSRRR